MAEGVLINVGAVTYDDSLGQYRESEPVTADYMIHNHYERDNHTYMAGLTAPEPFQGATVGVVRIGTPTMLWVAEWTACRTGIHPPVPDPTPAYGWVLLDATFSKAKVVMASNGVSPVYRIEGAYVYAKLAPSSSPFDDMSYPIAPWIKDSAGFIRKVPIESLRSLLDPSGVAGGGFQVAGKGEAGQGIQGPFNLIGKG